MAVSGIAIGHTCILVYSIVEEKRVWQRIGDEFAACPLSNEIKCGSDTVRSGLVGIDGYYPLGLSVIVEFQEVWALPGPPVRKAEIIGAD